MAYCSSYYLYQRYEKRGNQNWLPSYPNVYSIDGEGSQPLRARKMYDTECGWIPDEEPIYRWVTIAPSSDPSTYVCDDCGLPPTPDPIYRWTNSGTTCIGYDKYQRVIKQVSYDNGSTWENVSPVEYSATTLIESDSSDCGYVNPEQMPLTLIPLENGYFTVGLFDTDASCTVYYSTDSGITWQSLTLSSASTATIIATTGNKIMWMGNSHIGDLTFNSTCNYNVEGNVLSLDYGLSNFTGQTSAPNTKYGGRHNRLFNGSTKLISAKDLLLPHNFSNHSEYLGGGCAYLFRGCTSLTTPPQLPATTLPESCYAGMFQGCTSLTTPPQLPATTIAPSCYYFMFAGCTSLTTAPQLPATTIEERCYMDMFSGCTSLTVAPTLPATTLAESCYNGMFSKCTSLITPPQLPATTLSKLCYNAMFEDCSSLTTAPELPATILKESCYRYMFRKCTSLAKAPDLTALTLVSNCYEYMFGGCTNLKYIKCLATDISASMCTKYWTFNVSQTGTFVKNNSMSSWPADYDGIPINWTVQNA